MHFKLCYARAHSAFLCPRANISRFFFLAPLPHPPPSLIMMRMSSDLKRVMRGREFSQSLRAVRSSYLSLSNFFDELHQNAPHDLPCLLMKPHSSFIWLLTFYLIRFQLPITPACIHVSLKPFHIMVNQGNTYQYEDRQGDDHVLYMFRNRPLELNYFTDEWLVNSKDDIMNWFATWFSWRNLVLREYMISSRGMQK